jgi:5-methyltetrahydrofolate--homocysteine methyltransferase
MLLDGAMGTMLQQNGLKPGEKPELFNLTKPEIIKKIHTEYLQAGANIVLTNTFGANAHKLDGTGVTPQAVISSAVRIAKEAALPYGGRVALDIGPLGELLAPSGTLTFDDAYKLFAEQVIAGASAGADAVFIETMTDLLEMKCALLAAKENADLPVYCTMSFETNRRTFMGVPLSAMALTLTGLGADAIGLNCSVGPAEMYDMAAELMRWTNLPIIVKANAGLPSLVDGCTVFNVDENEFASHCERLLNLGVTAIGGCCGTTPAFIKKLAALIKTRRSVKRETVSVSALCSGTRTVVADRVRLIGERINPTGKKRFQEALKTGDYEYIKNQAAVQVEAGADILDINVGFPQVDERAAMVNAVVAVQSTTDAPLQIDSSDASVIEAALRVYNGKPIINSVNGEAESLERVLPLAKKYGAAIVGLTLDGDGIPRTAAGRLAIAGRIVNAALGYGIPREDVIIDCLTLTAGAEQESAYAAVEAIALVKERLNVKTVLGVSNISFGLPARDKMNRVFLTLAMGAGLDYAIVNPNAGEMVDAVYCFHQLKNIDKGSLNYIERFNVPVETVREKAAGKQAGESAGKSTGESAENSTGESAGKSTGESLKNSTGKPALKHASATATHNPGARPTLLYCVEKGLKAEIKPVVQEMLSSTDGLSIVREYLIPALDAVGKSYETGRTFLPQLLASSEAAQSAFEVIKASMPPGEGESAGKILLATVKGDIHDIGKNIVKVVLENYGYDVTDLGRDVDIDLIVNETVSRGIGLVGLSALMTTTVDSMERTIKALRAAAPDVKIMVGGAVLTEELAVKIGADYYSADAMSAVAVARKVYGA